jgi:selenocysteine-specific elongation factor
VPAAEKIRAALAERPFDPPSRKDLSQDRHFQQALRFLIDNGEVVEVAPEVVLLRESFEQMEARIVEFISKSGPATVSQLRETLQSSRRVMVPFLEYLDRTGVTQRSGDSRKLRKAKSAAIARR